MSLKIARLLAKWVISVTSMIVIRRDIFSKQELDDFAREADALIRALEEVE